VPAVRSLESDTPLEETMSGINGDKSRHHRLRKQKIQRRMRNRAMYGQINSENQAAAGSPKAPATVTTSKRNDAAHE
jgi:hypothetical protein